MGLRNAFVKGLKWSLIQQVFAQIINYVSIFWLAILITPEDFGKVALVVVLVGVFESINGFGVGQLIVRDNITEPKIISTYFWFVFLLSLGLTIICLATGAGYALLFELENLNEFYLIIVVSAISLVINGINSIFNALYSRDLNFKSPAQYFVLSLFLGNVFAIWAGYRGLGFWALIVKNLIPVVLLCLCFLFSRHYKILFYFSKVHILNTWSFTSNFTYFNALNFLIRNLDYIVIGKFFDLATVGQYSIAYKIMVFPMKNITSRIQAVLYPLLTKMKDDFKRIERTYSVIVSGIGYLTFPLAVLISSLATMWVPIFFNIEKYNQLIILVQILSVVGAVQAITSPVMSLYLISGKTKVLVYMGLVTALINGVGFLVGGITGDIYQFAFIYATIQLVISIPLSNYIPFRLMDFNFMNFLKRILIPFVAAVCSYFIVLWFIPIIFGSIYLKIGVLGVLGLTSYALILFLLSGGKIIDQMVQIKSMIIQK